MIKDRGYPLYAYDTLMSLDELEKFIKEGGCKDWEEMNDNNVSRRKADMRATKLTRTYYYHEANNKKGE